jgi:hypothetical protein
MDPTNKVNEELYWHCGKCGAHEKVEPTTPPYECGDYEKCIDCYAGWAVVVTLKQGAQMEQAVALGVEIPDFRKTQRQ